MKILIYALNYFPELTGIGKYVGEMAEWLAAEGHDVRVIAAPPYYPEWKVGAGYHAWKYTEEVLNGVRIFRCPVWVPARPTGLRRVIHLASFALSSAPVLLRQVFWRPDIFWVVEPPLFCAPMTLIASSLGGGKCWMHVQDFEVDAAFDLGLIRGSRLRAMVLACERWLLRRFHRVSTISGKMIDRLLSKGVDKNRIRMFSNWANLFDIQQESSSHYRTQLNIPADAVVAMYSGNMGAKQGLEVLARVVALLERESDIYFVFCGNGSAREFLERACEGKKNVKFLDLQPVDRLGNLLCSADVHLLPQRANAADLVMPSKLTGMLASGRAVVVGAHAGTELAHVVSSAANCGIVVAPENPDAFADAIVQLARNRDERLVYGENGRRYAEKHFEKNAVLTRFARDLIECVEG